MDLIKRFTGGRRGDPTQPHSGGVNKQILFFKLFAGHADGTRVFFPTQALCDGIGTLKGEDRYFRKGAQRVRAMADSRVHPFEIRFVSWKGGGSIAFDDVDSEDIQRQALPPNRGLAEETYSVFFHDAERYELRNVVGLIFNSRGPREGTIEQYLWAKLQQLNLVKDGVGVPQLYQVYHSDKMATDGLEVFRVELSVLPSAYVAPDEAGDIDKVVQAIQRASSPRVMHLQLMAEKMSKKEAHGLDTSFMDKFIRWVETQRSAVKTAWIRGKTPDERKDINLLQSRVVVTRTIPVDGGGAILRTEAYKAIREAYEENKDAIERGFSEISSLRIALERYELERRELENDA